MFVLVEETPLLSKIADSEKIAAVIARRDIMQRVKIQIRPHKE